MPQILAILETSFNPVKDMNPQGGILCQLNVQPH